ncbi:MAG: transporter [Proteobacteria bacterium]|nr:transporter [Pseudomonadota bacterium]
MTTSALPTYFARRDIHYGWVVAAVTFVTMLATAGALGAPGVMLRPLEAEFGWKNSDISTAFAVRLVLFGLMGPFSAALMNRFGVRRVVVTALLLIIAGFGFSVTMTSLWQLMLFWGVVIGFGTGMTATVLGATVATRWFVNRRGVVIGLLTASNATGQLIFLPVIAAATEAWGWRAALGLVVALLTIALLGVLLLMRDRPADVGISPYGGSFQPAPARTVGLLTLVSAPLLGLRDAARSYVFWALAATFFVCGLSTNGLIQTHWVTICGDYGVAPVSAAGLLAFIGVFDFFGTLLSGWLSDRYDNRWLLFWYYGLRGLSLLYLPLTGFDPLLLAGFAVFYGLDWIATVPPTVKLAAERFGAEKAGLVFGWIFTAHQLGAATAAYGAGWSRTDLESYVPALLVAGAFCLAAAALCLTIERKREPAAPLPQTA